MKKLIRKEEFILMMLAVLLGASQAKAQTFAAQWNGGTGNWSNAGDWSTGVVPNNAGTNIFNVTIDNAPTADTVTLGINATVNSLTLGLKPK